EAPGSAGAGARLSLDRGRDPGPRRAPAPALPGASLRDQRRGAVSGFLSRLSDRAAGPPAAAVSPRVGPVFPVRPPGRGNGPASAGVGADDGLGPHTADQT